MPDLAALDRLLIVGMGRSGVAAARAARLMLPGAEVTLSDSRTGVLDPATGAALTAEGIRLEAGGQGEDLLLGFTPQTGLIIKSPGIPRNIPLFEEALKRGIRIWGEVEFARSFLPHIFVGVTGTNGKTTTTELIGHILAAAGRDCRVAGNVGTALSTLVGQSPPEEILVVELSSFQLEDSDRLRPDIAVLLNLTEDHLDRHPDAADYFAAKKRIFANQQPGDVAVVNGDDPACQGPLPGQSQVLWFSREDRTEPAPAVFFREGKIMAEASQLGAAIARFKGLNGKKTGEAAPPGRTPTDSGEIPHDGTNSGERGVRPDVDRPANPKVVMAWSRAQLKGTHNLENAMAATAVCLSLGLEPGEVAAGLQSFPGVRHRLQVVRELDGVTYVNDSKATNVDAAAKALSAFTGPIHLILGGSLKGCSFEPLAQAVAVANVRQVLLIGEAASRIGADFAAAGIDTVMAETLEQALDRSRELARPGDVILLAPACASFDQYRNYEERGDHFISLVEKL